VSFQFYTPTILSICKHVHIQTVIGIGSGDYPHLNQACYYDFPHSIPGQCDETATPILQFGTIFRHAEMVPNMIAMPNPGHLKCFLKWGKKRQRCELFDLGGERDSESNFKVKTGQQLCVISSLYYVNSSTMIISDAIGPYPTSHLAWNRFFIPYTNAQPCT
jgi:hypothetical protein